MSTALRFNCDCARLVYARHILSILFGLVILVVDIVVPDLPDVFGLCGALGMSNFCYIVPGFVVLRAGQGMVARAIGAFSVMVGLFMLIVSTFFIIKGIIAT